MADNQINADYVRQAGNEADYEANAIESIARSWELKDSHCQ